MFAYIKFRVQRQLRRFRRDLRLWRIWTINYFDRHIWGKWRRLGTIRRFVVIWWSVLFIGFIGLWYQLGSLGSAYLMTGPRAGGIYSEGMVGTIKTINPILPEGEVSSDVSSLIFSGLTRINAKGNIEGDLANNWEISADGKTYTFHLRSGVKWHDGSPFTAQDVLFTLGLIQNPDTRSPLASSWQGVRAEAPNAATIRFVLPNPFAPFVYSTTFGILPKHLLSNLEPSSLRVADFNQQPIGTGPFKFTRMSSDQKEIDLAPNAHYYHGAPMLEQFEFRLFDSQQQVIQAYAKHQINAFGRAKPDDITGLGQATIHEMTQLDEVGLFMRVNNKALTATSVRQGIAAAIDRPKIIRLLGQEASVSVSLPILPGELGYSSKNQPPSFNTQAARSYLDASGWTADSHGQRQQDGHPLRLKMVTATSGNYPKVAETIKSDLERVGIAVDLAMVDTADLQQSYIRPRNYDLLLYGISIGPDPDVYAYWHSSQANDPGLNLSEYNSATADKALEAARLTSDNSIRAARYEKFLSVWTTDVPAEMLYMPSYLYVTPPGVKGITAHRLVSPSDRFYGVEHWTINTRMVARQ